MFMTNILTTALCLEILLWNASLAEWIDMPQFSDEKKVYRIPSLKQDHFHKFPQTSTSQFLYDYQSMVPEDLVTEGTVINGSGGNLSYELDSTNESGNRENFDEEDTLVISTEQYDETTVEEKSTNKRYSNESLLSNDTEILNYLPVDVLKSVHRTLKSQSTSSEGKILFLKAFERTLMAEIESRLTRTIIGGREKRGTDHYDHGHDYHEHDTGFPSIEGALMAISFLTFAVYLVRLVMLLFRNMNNSVPNTTGATLLLGKRKRSVNALDEDAAKILSAVERFSSHFQ